MWNVSKLFLTFPCQILNGFVKILRLASLEVMLNVLISRVKLTRELETIVDRHCSSAVMMMIARETIENKLALNHE
jgi:hypothetical protein